MAEQKDKTILYKKEGKVARITLNRPEKLNAMNQEMMGDLIAAIDEVEKDDDVSVVIINAAGQSFSSGFDLEMVYFIYGGGTGKPGERRPSQRARLHLDSWMLECFRRILYCWKPTICQVHGHCIGGGLYLATACDITIAAEDALIGHPEQRLAFAGATFMLIPQILLMGQKKTRELLLTGKLISGTEAEQINYVNYAVPGDQLETEVEKMAKTICLMPKDAIAVGKMQTRLAYDRLGFSDNMTQAFVGHSFATSIRFEDDEYNFLKGRREKGTRTAFHERDDRYTGLV
ncbi:MAG: enoyl-CoA hydratase/isomerase family protein [Chloroflexota bacterium]|nr:enoyl-CoA hydratase/isomerase family protein [Chloroflexota bacterium]